MPSNAELDRWLDTLREGLPQLKVDEEADFDYLAFQQQVERMRETLEPEQGEYLRARVQAMLEQAGLIPTDHEAESRR